MSDSDGDSTTGDTAPSKRPSTDVQSPPNKRAKTLPSTARLPKQEELVATDRTVKFFTKKVKWEDSHGICGPLDHTKPSTGNVEGGNSTLVPSQDPAGGPPAGVSTTGTNQVQLPDQPLAHAH